MTYVLLQKQKHINNILDILMATYNLLQIAVSGVDTGGVDRIKCNFRSTRNGFKNNISC